MNTDIRKIIKHSRQKYMLLFLILLALLASILVCNTFMGEMYISIKQILLVVAGKLIDSTLLSALPANVIAVVWSIRIPRIICGIFAGAGLAAAGTMFQAILQNPLADPYTLGISSGASLGASLAIYINIAYSMSIPITLSALVFSFAALAVVVLIASRNGKINSIDLIVAGIILSSFFSAGVSFIKMLSGENVGAIVFWMMGSLSSRNWHDAALLATSVSLLTLTAFFPANALNIMSLGDENAHTLGINTTMLRLTYLFIGACITAVCVSICGVIGFVGLIVPHLLRFWITADNRILIPLSALFGGILLAFADNISRVFFSGEIPVGVITTLVGGPFFIYVFTRKERINAE